MWIRLSLDTGKYRVPAMSVFGRKGATNERMVLEVRSFVSGVPMFGNSARNGEAA